MNDWSYHFEYPKQISCTRLSFQCPINGVDILGHRLSQVKDHRAAVLAKEREVVTREEALRDKERRLTGALSEKDAEISRLQAHITHIQHQPQITQRDVELAIKQAISRREEELRVLIQNREKEVSNAIAKREEEIMEAVRTREAEVCRVWHTRETEVKQEVEASIKFVKERVEWILRREDELKVEEGKIEEMRRGIEERMRVLEASQKGNCTVNLAGERNLRAFTFISFLFDR
jgi:NIMA (never in mitosis gene a)-related kinase